MKNTKAQVEIMGLVFLVLIITIAMLFYLSYAVKQKTEGTDSVFAKYTNTETSFSFVKVFLDTSACGTTIQELIKDCATSRRINCNGFSSCDVVNATLFDIKNETLDKWGKPYGIMIEYNSVYNLTNFTYGCDPNLKVIGREPPGIYYVPLYPGEVKITMNICSY